MPQPKPPSAPGFGVALASCQGSRPAPTPDAPPVPDANLPDQIWAMDESRFGLRIDLKRRWCPRGVRPPWVVDDQYQWVWLYAAVEPMTGRAVFCYLPEVTKAWFACFLEHLSRAVGAGQAVVVLDNAGSHRAAIPWPAQLTPLPLPPYSPELNPAEQIFRVVRAKLANHIFATLEELEPALTACLQEFWEDPAILYHLTAYPWWRAGVEAMMSTNP